MKLKNIPDYFETHRHKDTGLCQRVYIDKYKTNEAPSSLFEKEKNAISLLKKEDARLFKKSLIVVFIGLAIFVIGLFVCRTVEHLGAGMQYTLGLMIPLFINQFVNSWATYLRCHKQEPFLINSICGGIACCLSTFILGNYFGLYGITIGYCFITMAFMPWGYWIYKTKKTEWHGK